MNITRKLYLASALALLIAAPVLAQAQDYYAPGPATRVTGQLNKTQEGDYYVGSQQIMSHQRVAAFKKCTTGIAFDSDSYVACMGKEGQSP